MAMNQVILADVSTLTVDGVVIEAAQSFQASRNTETRPIYTFNKSKPVLIVSVPGIGQGSFAYIASNGTGSDADVDWSATLTGAETIVVTGVGYGDPSPVTQTLTFAKCTFGGQSTSMNARGEMQCNVNFFFGDGSTF